MPFVISETSSTPFTATTTQPLFTTSEITPPAQPAFASDLLGDFGETVKEGGGLISTSPTPGAEFPVNEAYRHEEQLDNFAAMKTIKNRGDSFDAFASKFDKAAEPEINGDPFLDAFNSGTTAMDTSSDGMSINFVLSI